MRLILIFTILFFNLHLSAQTYFGAFRKISTENDLSDPYVTSLVIDNDGFLWIGTDNGLLRYDGVAFQKYFHQKTNASIPHNTINTIIPIKHKNLLICTNNGLCLFNTTTNKFKLPLYPPGTEFYRQAFYTSCYDGSNTIYVTGNNQIYSLDTNLNIRYCIRRLEDTNDKKAQAFLKVGKVLKIDGKIIAQLYLNNGNWSFGQIAGDRLLPLNDADPIGQILQTTTVKSDYITDEKLQIYRIKLLSDSLYTYYLKEKKGQRTQIANVNRNQFYSNSIFLCNNDSLFICNSSVGGLLAFNKPSKIQAGNKLSIKGEWLLKNKSISCALLDKFGNLWVGTNQGIYNAAANTSALNTTIFPERHSLTQQAGKNEMVFFTGNSTYITTSGNGFFYKNGYTLKGQWQNKIWHNNQKGCNDVWNIRQHSKDTVWIGTQTGMHWFNPAENTIGKVSWDKAYKLIDKVPVTTQFVDSRHLLWMGLGGGHGLAVYDLHARKMVYFFQSHTKSALPVRDVLTITEDINGDMWMGNYDVRNILHWNRRSNDFSTINLLKTFPEIRGLTSTIADSEGNIWFATTDGLFNLQIKTGQLKRLMLPGGTTNYDVSSLDLTPDGTIWFSTLNGIFYCKNLKVYKHLQTNAFNDSLISHIKYNRSNNKLYFVTAHSVSSFNIQSNPRYQQSLVIFTDNILLNERSLRAKDGFISLPYNYQLLTIKYTAIDLMAGNSLHYFYSVNNSRWVNLGTQRQLNLINLKSGSYVLKIKAQSTTGQWSENQIQLNIEIAYPFWQTWLFTIGMIFLSVVIIYVIYRYQINQFKQLQNIRDGIARNLHDDIGTSLTNINILALLGVKHMAEPDKAAGFLKRIEEEINTTAESLGDIVWSINSSNDSLNGLLGRMRQYATELFENSNTIIKISISESVTDQKLNVEQVHDIYMIFKENLINVIKHAKANTFSVIVKTESNQMLIVLEDDGVGFDPAKPSKGNGLNNMQKRAAHWSGKIKIQSVKGKGTNCSINIPLKR